MNCAITRADLAIQTKSVAWYSADVIGVLTDFCMCGYLVNEHGLEVRVAGIEAASALHEADQQVQGRFRHYGMQVTAGAAQLQLIHQQPQQAKALGINGALY